MEMHEQWNAVNSVPVVIMVNLSPFPSSTVKSEQYGMRTAIGWAHSHCLRVDLNMEF